MKILTSLAIILLLGCTGRIPKVQKSVNIQFSIVKKLDSLTLENKKFPAYEIEMKVNNQTDSTFFFWTNLCSWFDNIIPSDQFQFYNQGCDNNYLSLINIDSGKRIQFYSKIIIIKPLQINKEIKIEYILIAENEINKTDDFYQFKTILSKKKLNHKDVLKGILKIK